MKLIAALSILGVAAYPIALAVGMWRQWLVVGSWWWVLLSALVATVAIGKHRENIARLRAATEPRLGDGRRRR